MTAARRRGHAVRGRPAVVLLAIALAALVAACATTRLPGAVGGRYVVIEIQTGLDRADDVMRAVTRPQEARFADIAALQAVRSVSQAGRSVVELEYEGGVRPQDLAAARVIARHTFREQAHAARAGSMVLYVSERPVLSP